MFRESDYAERRIHPSYTTKPVPVFQLHCQTSKFVEKDDSQLQPQNTVVEPVPTTWDTFYDPSHPDADW